MQWEIWRYIFNYLSKQAGTQVTANVQSSIVMRRYSKKICTRRSSAGLRMQKIRLDSTIDTILINKKEGATLIGQLLGCSLLIGVRKKFRILKKIELNHSQAETQSMC